MSKPLTNVRTEVTHLIVAVIDAPAQVIPQDTDTQASRMVLANGTLIEFPTRVYCEVIGEEQRLLTKS